MYVATVKSRIFADKLTYTDMHVRHASTTSYADEGGGLLVVFAAGEAQRPHGKRGCREDQLRLHDVQRRERAAALAVEVQLPLHVAAKVDLRMKWEWERE